MYKYDIKGAIISSEVELEFKNEVSNAFIITSKKMITATASKITKLSTGIYIEKSAAGVELHFAPAGDTNIFKLFTILNPVVDTDIKGEIILEVTPINQPVTFPTGRIIATCSVIVPERPKLIVDEPVKSDKSKTK